jgi:hypothetical protein
MNRIVQQLNELTQATAQEVMATTIDISIRGYQQFLDMMYHYTRYSGQRLEHASQNAQQADIRELFCELAIEEAHHYRLAQSDLTGFGLTASQSPPQVVQDFHQFWLNIQSEEEMAYVGSMFVLENVANYLGTEVKQRLADLNIQAKQARFILVHLEADADHGHRLSTLCEHCNDQDLPYLLKGARYSKDFFVEMHRVALQ